VPPFAKGSLVRLTCDLSYNHGLGEGAFTLPAGTIFSVLYYAGTVVRAICVESKVRLFIAADLLELAPIREDPVANNRFTLILTGGFS
jgi:hypothetical protein